MPVIIHYYWTGYITSGYNDNVNGKCPKYDNIFSHFSFCCGNINFCLSTFILSLSFIYNEQQMKTYFRFKKKIRARSLWVWFFFFHASHFKKKKLDSTTTHSWILPSKCIGGVQMQKGNESRWACLHLNWCMGNLKTLQQIVPQIAMTI